MPYGTPLYRLGDQVEIRFPGERTWFGVVEKVHWKDMLPSRDDPARGVPCASYDILTEYDTASDERNDGDRPLPRSCFTYRNVDERFVIRAGYALPRDPAPLGRWPDAGEGRDGSDEGRSGRDRILFSGDIHNKGRDLCPMIERAADRTGAGVIVLLGDLLNEWTSTPGDEIEAFSYLADWVERQRRRREVVVLLGNHDLTYAADSGTPDYRAFKETCPGYNEPAYPEVHPLLMRLKPQIMYGFTDAMGSRVLASHAGLTGDWYRWMANRIARFPDGDGTGPETAGAAGAKADAGAMSAEELAALVNAFADGRYGGGLRPFGIMVGPERGGWNRDVPSPVWAGMEELARDPMPGFHQIVAHTPVPGILYRACGADAATDLWYCDTHSLRHDGRHIGDDSLLLYDRSTGEAWAVRP